MSPRYEWNNGGSHVTATVEEGVLVSPIGKFLQSEDLAIATRSEERFKGMDERAILQALIQEAISAPVITSVDKEKYIPGDTFWQEVIDQNGQTHSHLSGSSF